MLATCGGLGVGQGVDAHLMKRKTIRTCTCAWIHKQRKTGSHKMERERPTKAGERVTCVEGRQIHTRDIPIAFRLL